MKSSAPLSGVLSGSISGAKLGSASLLTGGNNTSAAPATPEKKKAADAQSLTQSALKSALSSLSRKNSGSK